MLHRTRFELEYAPLYETPIQYGTTVWSPLASGLLTGKYNNKQFQGGDNRLGLQGDSAWIRQQLESGQGLNGLEEKNVDQILEKVDKLKPIAERFGVPLAQLALAWVAKNPHVSTVITGASRASQVAENFKAVALLPKLTSDVMEEIDQVLKNKPKGAFDWTKAN